MTRKQTIPSTVTLKRLAAEFADKSELPKELAEAMLKELAERVSVHLKRGDRIRFGNFRPMPGYGELPVPKQRRARRDDPVVLKSARKRATTRKTEVPISMALKIGDVVESRSLAERSQKKRDIITRREGAAEHRMSKRLSVRVGETVSLSEEYAKLQNELVAVRFTTGEEVDRAIDILFDDPRLRNMPWDTPDGYELHLPARAATILKGHGLAFRIHSLAG